MLRSQRSSRAGFTLIELLIVVVVIGILASLAVARFERVRQRSHVAAMQSDLRNLMIAEEGYHMEHIVYTTTLTDLEFTQTQGVEITVNSADNQGWGATATHLADSSIQCGVYVGSAPAADGVPATLPEVVECTF